MYNSVFLSSHRPHNHLENRTIFRTKIVKFKNTKKIVEIILVVTVRLWDYQLLTAAPGERLSQSPSPVSSDYRQELWAVPTPAAPGWLSLRPRLSLWSTLPASTPALTTWRTWSGSSPTWRRSASSSSSSSRGTGSALSWPGPSTRWGDCWGPSGGTRWWWCLTGLTRPPPDSGGGTWGSARESEFNTSQTCLGRIEIFLGILKLSRLHWKQSWRLTSNFPYSSLTPITTARTPKKAITLLRKQRNFGNIWSLGRVGKALQNQILNIQWEKLRKGLEKSEKSKFS